MSKICMLVSVLKVHCYYSLVPKDVFDFLLIFFRCSLFFFCLLLPFVSCAAFNGAEDFNGDISKWNTNKVDDMSFST